MTWISLAKLLYIYIVFIAGVVTNWLMPQNNKFRVSREPTGQRKVEASIRPFVPIGGTGMVHVKLFTAIKSFSFTLNGGQADRRTLSGHANIRLDRILGILKLVTFDLEGLVPTS